MGPWNQDISGNLREPITFYETFLRANIAQRVKDYQDLEIERILLNSANSAKQLEHWDRSQPFSPSLLTAQERATLRIRADRFEKTLWHVTNHDDYRDLSTSWKHLRNTIP